MKHWREEAWNNPAKKWYNQWPWIHGFPRIDFVNDAISTLVMVEEETRASSTLRGRRRRTHMDGVSAARCSSCMPQWCKAREWFKSSETAREGEELPEPNVIMELKVCAMLQWLRSGKIYRALGLYRSWEVEGVGAALVDKKTGGNDSLDDQVTNMREMKRHSKVDEGLLLPLLVAQRGWEKYKLTFLVGCINIRRQKDYRRLIVLHFWNKYKFIYLLILDRLILNW